MSEPTKELADEIFRRRVRQARKTPPGQKLMDGFRLYERACGLMRDGIRHQFPNADDAEVEEILRKRLKRARQIEEYGIYQDDPPERRFRFACQSAESAVELDGGNQ
jgi:hypothetical protein